ncbi:hypothetical protein ACQPW1_10370 [Nocardia sp. CA-128927]|uniref:hypothetical protein n=1 Tax=Nocardia sp. CA-128927 TaxID=3239975 RepID=UPI003D982127
MDPPSIIGAEEPRHTRYLPALRRQYFNREGQPITDEQLHQLLQDPDYCVLACTATGCGWVQTEFVGEHHSWTGVGKPLLFRTTIFGGRRDGEVRRSGDEREAMWCHNAWVEQQGQ